MSGAVSVVLPVRNGERYLRAALESVLAQDYAFFVLIVVDDGSTDASVEIAHSYGDPRLTLIAQPAGGISAALNRGIAETKTPYVARMDADDVSYPSRLGRQVRFLDSHPEVGLVASCFAALSPQGHHQSVRGVPLHDDDIRRLLPAQNPFCHGSVMMRRDVLTRVGGYRVEMEPAEDYDLWVRLARVTSFAALPDVLYGHRANQEGVSTSATAAQQARAHAVQREALTLDQPRSLPLEVVRRRRGEYLQLRDGHERARVAAYAAAQRAEAVRLTRLGARHQHRQWIAALVAGGVSATPVTLKFWVRTQARRLLTVWRAPAGGSGR